MPWNFRSPMFPTPEEEERNRELLDAMRRASKTRDGKLILAEALLFFVTAIVMAALLFDAIKNKSLQSAGLVLLLFLLTFWPFLRHRLKHGDWPDQ